MKVLYCFGGPKKILKRDPTLENYPYQDAAVPCAESKSSGLILTSFSISFPVGVPTMVPC